MSDLALERVLSRDRWIIGGCVRLIAAVAWLWLWRSWAAMGGADTMARMEMPGMDMSGATRASPANAVPYLTSTFAMWLLMMIAMMLPSATPMILLYGRLARGARAQGATMPPTAIFASVYVAVWAGFSTLAAVAQWLLVRSGLVSELTLAVGDRRGGGAMLIAGGLYQATPPKRACLEARRSPLPFLMRLWRPGWLGAARLGFAHGVYRLGYCALLMILLFVFGVMNLIWVALLSLFVLIEKVLPSGSRIGAVAVIVGLIMIFK